MQQNINLHKIRHLALVSLCAKCLMREERLVPAGQPCCPSSGVPCYHNNTHECPIVSDVYLFCWHALRAVLRCAPCLVSVVCALCLSVCSVSLSVCAMARLVCGLRLALSLYTTPLHVLYIRGLCSLSYAALYALFFGGFILPWNFRPNTGGLTRGGGKNRPCKTGALYRAFIKFPENRHRKSRDFLLRIIPKFFPGCFFDLFLSTSRNFP